MVGEEGREGMDKEGEADMIDEFQINVKKLLCGQQVIYSTL